MKRFFVSFFVTLSLMMFSQQGSALQSRATFIQTLDYMKPLTLDDWRNEFRAMDYVGINEIFIQWAQFDQLELWGGEGTENDLVGRILTVADEFGFKVHIGVMYHSNWFSARGWESVSYMLNSINTNRVVLPAIYERYKNHKSFVGWYIPQEISDVDAEYVDKLNHYYKSLTEVAKALDDEKSVSMSAFFVGKFTPTFVEYNFTNLLKGTGIDNFLLQIGYGVRDWRNFEEFVAPYLRAFKYAAERNDIKFWAIQETFHQINTINDFVSVETTFEPMHPDLILQRQVDILDHSDDRLVYFEFYHYLSPYRGDKQKNAFRILMNSYPSTLFQQLTCYSYGESALSDLSYKLSIKGDQVRIRIFETVNSEPLVYLESELSRVINDDGFWELLGDGVEFNFDPIVLATPIFGRHGVLNGHDIQCKKTF